MEKPTTKGLETLVKEKIAPAELVTRVRQQPIVNTFGEQAAIMLETVNLIPVPGKEAHFRYFERGDQAIYWKSSENDIGVEIIGVVWDRNRNQRVVCGIILPP